jgi:hypothetical protein
MTTLAKTRDMRVRAQRPGGVTRHRCLVTISPGGAGALLGWRRAGRFRPLEAHWRVNSVLTLRAGINNVLDKDPPLIDSFIGRRRGRHARRLRPVRPAAVARLHGALVWRRCSGGCSTCARCGYSARPAAARSPQAAPPPIAAPAAIAGRPAVVTWSLSPARCWQPKYALPGRSARRHRPIPGRTVTPWIVWSHRRARRSGVRIPSLENNWRFPWCGTD